MIETRLTKALGLTHPVMLAPMAGVSGGALAAAAGRGGGLGLIGGGYCDADWIDAQFAAAGNQSVGCGFITWKLAETPALLTSILARKPRAVFLSFGDPAPFAEEIHAAGVTLICQVQDMAGASRALEAGARVIVAQGTEAGGHGARRATFTLVPEIADFLAARGSDALLVAAGGVADGRGLAAALMLGADGVLMGSRFWASAESLAPDGHVAAALAADGDATLRTNAVDIVRGLDWPAGYDIRVMKNAFTRRWHDDPAGLKAAGADEAERWRAAAARGDASIANPVVGEAVGLLHDRPPAAVIIERVMSEAQACLDGKWRQR